MRTMKEILHTADGIGDKPMHTGSHPDVDELVAAARVVVATAFGDTYGLSVESQLEALRCAASVLRDELDQWE